MKNNPTGISGFYRCDENNHHTIRTAVELTESIDPAALRKAVDIAIKRYDYYSVKFVLQKGELLHSVLHNDRQVVITEGVKPPLLLSEESNEHALSVNYDGNTVYFDIVHSITDETGIMEFIKTTLYYYITEKYGKEFPTGSIRTADMPVTEGERRDPFLDVSLPDTSDTNIAQHSAGAAVPALEWGKIIPYSGEKTVYKMSFDEDAFMEYVKANGATPSIMVSGLLAQTVFGLSKEQDGPFRTVLMKNYRKAVNAPLAHNNVLGNIILNYTEQMRELTLPQLCAQTRQMMDYQSTDEYMRGAIQNRLLKERRILASGDLNTIRQSFIQSSNMNRKFVNATVSYVRIQELGALEPYIKSVYTYVDPAASNVIVEVNAVNGKFCVTVLQNFASSALADGFAALLEQAGIKFEKSGEPLISPKFKIS